MYKMNRTRVSDAMCKYFISANGNSPGNPEANFYPPNSSTDRAISVDPWIQSESYLYFNFISSTKLNFSLVWKIFNETNSALSLPTLL